MKVDALVTQMLMSEGNWLTQSFFCYGILVMNCDTSCVQLPTVAVSLESMDRVCQNGQGKEEKDGISTKLW